MTAATASAVYENLVKHGHIGNAWRHPFIAGTDKQGGLVAQIHFGNTDDPSLAACIGGVVLAQWGAVRFILVMPTTLDPVPNGEPIPQPALTYVQADESGVSLWRHDVGMTDQGDRYAVPGTFEEHPVEGGLFGALQKAFKLADSDADTELVDALLDMGAVVRNRKDTP